MNRPQQKQTLNINPDDLPDIACDCGNLTFMQGFKLKKMSALISPSGKEGFMSVPAMVCVKCFEVLPAKMAK
jgi:hypothetical protein